MSAREVAPRDPRRESARRRLVAEFVDELLPFLDQPSGSADREMERRSVTLRLGRAVTAGNAALGHPPPTTVELASALDVVNRERGLSWHVGGLEANIYEEVLEKLPRDVRRALLASFHPEYGQRLTNQLRETWKELLFPWLEYWFAEIRHAREWHAWEIGEWSFDDAYPPASEASANELRLEEVAADTKRTKGERIDAARQLSNLEAARLRRRTVVGHRPKRGRRGRRSPEKRFAELAAAAGYAEPAGFGALAKRGKPSATESERLRQLGRAANTLRDEGYTLESIGAVMGRRNRQRVFELIARSA